MLINRTSVSPEALSSVSVHEATNIVELCQMIPGKGQLTHCVRSSKDGSSDLNMHVSVLEIGTDASAVVIGVERTRTSRRSTGQRETKATVALSSMNKDVLLPSSVPVSYTHL